MNILNDLKNIIFSITQKSMDSGFLIKEKIPDFIVEPTKTSLHGDFATNIAFLLAKSNKKKPLEIAAIISERLNGNSAFAKTEIAHPGFINMFLSVEFLSKIVHEINEKGEDFSSLNKVKNEKLNIEFVSANPTGPMHIGHARGAILGDVLANVFEKIGYDVTREFYINDAGSQVDQLIHSVYCRYLELLGEEIKKDSFAYPGEYIIDVAKELKDEHDTALRYLEESERKKILTGFTIKRMLDLIRSDLQLLDVHHDVFTSEKKLRDEQRVEKTIDFLMEKNLVYLGVPEKPKGGSLEEWEPKEQLMFKATLYNDTVDRSLQKPSGEWTYFAVDVAYHFYKYERGFEKMVVILGKDHDGYLKRIKAAVSAMSNNKAELEVVFHNIVNFYDNGIALKMSKRSGRILCISDVINEVGREIVRFNMISADSNKILDFDFHKLKDQSKENHLFYIQYAHARCHSVVFNIKGFFMNIKEEDGNTLLLSDEKEIAIMRLLALWHYTIELVGRSCQPHYICLYLNQLATAFHAMWNAGNDNKNLRFLLEEDKDTTNARMSLVVAVKNIISSGLKIIGISPLNYM